jgi:hypothetical protein
MSTEKLLKPTPIRLHGSTHTRLRQAAARFRLRPAEIIRQAVDQKLTEWERGAPITIQGK